MKGFESQTEQLNDFELNQAIPIILKHLPKKIGKANAVTGAAICQGILNRTGSKLKGPRLRKIIHYIRSNHLIPGLVGTSSGYFVAQSKKELQDYAESLTQRIQAIETTRTAVLKDLNRFAQ